MGSASCSGRQITGTHKYVMLERPVSHLLMRICPPVSLLFQQNQIDLIRQLVLSGGGRDNGKIATLLGYSIFNSTEDGLSR